MRSPLRVESFLGLDRNEDSSHTFPSVLVSGLHDAVTLSGRVVSFYALDQNEGLSNPPILDCFAMGSPYGSSVVFLPTRSKRSFFG